MGDGGIAVDETNWILTLKAHLFVQCPEDRTLNK